jgi:hypothetical protein
MDWNRHDKNTYQMIEHWFKVVGRLLADPAIERECHDKNTYQMIEHWFKVVGRLLADPAIERECV